MTQVGPFVGVVRGLASVKEVGAMTTIVILLALLALGLLFWAADRRQRHPPGAHDIGPSRWRNDQGAGGGADGGGDS
jgi:hypothetical protein